METPQKLDLKDILTLYAGRRDAEDEPLPSIEPLNIDKGKLRANLSSAAQISEKAYENTETLLEGVEISDGAITSRTSLLCNEVVDELASLRLVVTLQQSHTKGGASVPGLLKSSLYRGELGKEELKDIVNQRPHEQKPVAEMVVVIRGNEFDLAHRIVRPEFRRQGLGDAMLQFLEEFLCRKGAEEGREQKLGAMVCQLDVICWLWNNGYRPGNSEDQLKLEKILAGDAKLCIGKKKYVFPKSVDPLERVSLNSHNSALRMKFEKKISPGTPADMSDAKTDVRSSVKGIVEQ